MPVKSEPPLPSGDEVWIADLAGRELNEISGLLRERNFAFTTSVTGPPRKPANSVKGRIMVAAVRRRPDAARPSLELVCVREWMPESVSNTEPTPST